jgi:hypothetical protein
MTEARDSNCAGALAEGDSFACDASYELIASDEGLRIAATRLRAAKA